MTESDANEERSAQMRLIRSKDTKPELIVRKALHALGYRYRLHAKNLPGHPDLTFARFKKVIYVHGCFWHRHAGCKKNRTPKSKLDYWGPKFAANVARDSRNQKELQEMGWGVLVVWECELKNMEVIMRKIISFLENGNETLL